MKGFAKPGAQPQIEAPGSVFAQLDFTRGDAVVPLVDKIVSSRIGRDPRQHAAVLDFAMEQVPPQAMPHFLDRYVRKWLLSDPDGARDWLASRGLNVADVEAATASFKIR